MGGRDGRLLISCQNTSMSIATPTVGHIPHGHSNTVRDLTRNLTLSAGHLREKVTLALAADLSAQ